MKPARLIKWLLFFAVLAGCIYLAWPFLKNMQRMAALLAAPAPTAKSLPNPVRGAVLVDTWGGMRSGGRRHEGIDLFAPRDTPIFATTDGMVSHVGENKLGGLTITVLGPAGYRHYYAHLERYTQLRVGDWVTAGTVVGYVGDSGNAKGTPTHLHYGIYTPAGAINPYPLLRR